MFHNPGNQKGEEIKTWHMKYCKYIGEELESDIKEKWGLKDDELVIFRHKDKLPLETSCQKIFSYLQKTRPKYVTIIMACHADK